jgi:1,4-dihydroxy-2-naphthoate octaprenyltransferase
LQTKTIDVIPILPAVIVSILIFLVIFVNEFPDLKADAAVNKRTLVVIFGVPAAIWIYRVVLAASFPVAAAMLIYRSMFYAGLFYLFTLPIAIVAIRSVNKKDLTTPGKYRASQITVILHALGSLALAAGFIVSSIYKPLF